MTDVLCAQPREVFSRESALGSMLENTSDVSDGGNQNMMTTKAKTKSRTKTARTTPSSRNAGAKTVSASNLVALRRFAESPDGATNHVTLECGNLSRVRLSVAAR
jgi:hypothetical protein